MCNRTFRQKEKSWQVELDLLKNQISILTNYTMDDKKAVTKFAILRFPQTIVSYKI